MQNRIKTLQDLELFFNEKNAFDFFGVDQLGVFGSFARGEHANDIDILMRRPKMKQKGLLRFILDLEKNSGKKFDFVMEEFANPIILNRAQKDMRYVRKHSK